MKDHNRVSLIGRLTRDAELKFLPNGSAVSRFSIAGNYPKKVGDNWTDEVNYFDIVLWGKQAETLDQYLVKGKQVGIDGQLRQERWEKDGQRFSRVEVVADSIQLLGDASGNRTGNDSRNSGGYSKPSARQAPAGDDGLANDIPF
jgi:single-strand DNA-binding protein